MERTNDASAWTKASEIELIYKCKVKASERPCIKCSQDCYRFFLNHWDDHKLDFVEQFKVVLLNRSNQVLGICEISTGGVSGTIADPKLIFAAAILANASGIIICHNHPSSCLKPSRADEQLTQKIFEAGLLLDLPLKDHIIVTRDGYFSFVDNGLL